MTLGGLDTDAAQALLRAAEILAAAAASTLGRMDRPRYRVSLRRPHRKSGRNWQLYVYTPDGRRYQRSAGTPDRAEAERRRAAEERRLNGEATTLADVAGRYLEHAASTGELRAATIQRYRRALELVAARVDVVSAESLAKARDELRATYAASTVRSALTAARSAWVWARERGLVAYDWPGVRAPRPEPTRLRPPTPAEVQRLLEVAREDQGGRYYPLVRLLVETGARIGETLALRERDVDRTPGAAMIYLERRAKTRASRRAVPISDDCAALLPVPSAPDRHVFVGVRSGRRLHTGSVTTAILRMLERAGLDGEQLGGPHMFRRAWVAAARASGVRQDVSMQLVGHRDAQTHADYARRAPSADAADAAARVRARLLGITYSPDTLRPEGSGPRSPSAPPATSRDDGPSAPVNRLSERNLGPPQKFFRRA